MTVKYEAVKIEEGTETARWINSCRTSTTPNRSQGRCTPDNTVIVCIHSHTYTVRGRTLGSTKHSSGSTTEFWGLWENTWCVYFKTPPKGDWWPSCHLALLTFGAASAVCIGGGSPFSEDRYEAALLCAHAWKCPRRNPW